MYFFILPFFLSSISSYETVKVWQCAPNHLSHRCLSVDTIFSENSQIKYELTYITRCNPTYHCQELKGLKYRTCVKNFPPGFSGDYCELNSDCYSGICLNRICIGLKEGDECSETNQCGPNLACYSQSKFEKRTCLPLIKEGNVCILRDNEDEINGSFGNCDKGLVCATYDLVHNVNFFNDKILNSKLPRCIKLGSLPDQTPCRNPFACDSGLILHGKCTYVTPGKIILNYDDMNICEFKSSTYKGEHIEEVECKRSSKGEVKHPYENIHNNWRTYVNAYFERLEYISKDFNFNHHSFYLDSFDVRSAYLYFIHGVFLSDADECTLDYWMNSHNRFRF